MNKLPYVFHDQKYSRVSFMIADDWHHMLQSSGNDIHTVI